jgi:hypothetical protein
MIVLRWHVAPTGYASALTAGKPLELQAGVVFAAVLA